MKFILTILISLTLTWATGQNIFQKSFGTTAYEEIWEFDLTSDSGFILGGYTGFGNAYIIKLNSHGDTTWTKNIDATGLDLLYSIKQTKDNGFIAGGRTNSFGAGGLDMLLIKTDVTGNNQWTKTIGGGGDETASSIKQTTDGGFVIAGNTKSFGAGLNDFYVVKTDVNGNIIWSKSIGGTGNDNAYSIIQTADSGYISVGLTASAGAGNNDILAVKFNNAGSVVWMKTYGGTGDDRANSIIQTVDGGFIISGVTNSFGAGNYDFNLIKTDSLGNFIWEKTFGGTGNEWSYSVQQTNDNGFILTGYTTSFGAGGGDYYLIKTNSIGDTSWTKTFGGTMAEYGTAVKQTSDNGFAIIGYGQSFGAGSYDFYFVKTDSNGNGICNQNNTATIVSGQTSTVTTPTLTISSGGVNNSSSPVITEGAIVNSLCTNVGVQYLNVSNPNFYIYPNPTSDQSTLQFDNKKAELCTLTLYDLRGQIMRTINNITSDQVVIQKNDLTTGLYYFVLRTSDRVIVTGKLAVD